MTKREKFIKQKWLPFLARLDAIHKETIRRTQLGYDIAQRLPTQSTLNSLSLECMSLTKEYYGTGNISAIYVFLMKISVSAGITFYDPLPVIMSNDGYLGIIDRNKQQELSQSYRTNIRAEYLKHGGRIISGRSAIDNTIYPNIFLLEHGRRLIARQGVMRAVVKFISLLKYNKVQRKIENAGQLSQSAKEFLWAEICAAIPDMSHTVAMQQFVEFIHKYPGEYFNSSPTQHRMLLFTGLSNNELKAVPRKTMVNITPHRFVKMSYKRQIPLRAVQDGKEVILRDAGAEEIILLRPNEGHYLREHHGMSLASGCQTRIFNLFFPQDPECFKRSNRYPDIEWMVIEALSFNSARDLPNEHAVMVGRNSFTGSSIKQTAHSQLVCATLEEFPHYAINNAPRRMSNLDAIIDFIQIGTVPDACCMKIITKNYSQSHF